MTILDLQRRLAEVGRIRLGEQVSSNGRKRPAKLNTFRLTSADRTRIAHAANLYGGTPRQWEAPAGKQWEVVTSTDALNVIVPPSDMAFTQWYELWSAAGCQRRCDGNYESISDSPCLCEDPSHRECNIHSRLSVLLADLPGLGVWRVESSGYYAAVELQGAVEIIRLAAGRGQLLPARLRLEQRAVKRTDDKGKPITFRFAVPVLDIDVTPGRLIGSGGPLELPATLPHSGEENRNPPQIDGAAPPIMTPVPDTPGPTVAAQMRTVEKAPKRASRSLPVKSTGVQPRTRTEADQQGVELDRITSAQSVKLHALLKSEGLGEREDGLAYIGAVIGRDITSTKELFKAEAITSIDDLEKLRTARLEREAQRKADQPPPRFENVPLPEASDE